jgi:hypothetical protein
MTVFFLTASVGDARRSSMVVFSDANRRAFSFASSGDPKRTLLGAACAAARDLVTP